MEGNQVWERLSFTCAEQKVRKTQGGCAGTGEENGGIREKIK